MTMRSRKIPALLAATALASVGLAACGGGSDDTSSSPATTTSEETSSSTSAAASGSGSTVSIEADPSGNLAFTKTDITAKPGNDTIEFNNPSSVAHNVEIEDSSGEDVAGTDTITGAKTSTTADLQPGTYTFYCSVPGHREAGMEGTITVK
jgi:plastocyanin